MQKKFILGVLFILTIFVGATYINLVSAESSATRVSTTLVISQVYGGGGSTSGTPTYAKDYIELKNISSSPQSLNGLSLQYGSATGQFGSSATNVFALPDVTVQPGRYYLVELGPVGTVGANLPVTADASTTNLTISATNGKVALTNGLAPNSCGATATPCVLPNAQIIDLVAFGTANNAEGNASVAVLSNTTGAVRNGDGCVDTDNNANDFTVVTNPVPRNSSSPAVTCSGGTTPTPTVTPTATPTVTPTATPTPTPTPTPSGTPIPGVVINEIYGGGGNANALYNQDFVELYNNSSANVDINGYSLQYASATNATATGYAVCAITATDTVIEPGTYFLIATGPVGTVGVNLPTVNATCPTSINLSGTAGKVTLVNGTTVLNGTTCPPTGATIVDFVGYGSTANCSDTAPAPSAADNQSSISRTPVGRDTNNNAVDFVSGATSPTAGGNNPTPTPTPTQAPRANADFNGDGKTDFSVTRVISGAKTWYTSINGTGAFSGTQFGTTGDVEVPEDFDGDGKDDIAVWRPGTAATFYILQSNGSVFRAVSFGLTGDDPKVVADYDGDNKADVAVYRKGATQNYFYYIASSTGNFSAVQWGGGTTTRPNVGDYDGDGKADFCVHYDSGNGSGIFAVLRSSGGTDFTPFGLVSDKLVPGDYDGDGKSDFTVVRASNGLNVWYKLTRTGSYSNAIFGFSTDVIVPGDYDGDRKQDLAVWRPSSTSDASVFYALRSTDGGVTSLGFGAGTDVPVAGWLVH